MRYSPLSFFWHREAARAQAKERCLEVYKALAPSRWSRKKKQEFAKTLKELVDQTSPVVLRRRIP